MPGREKQPNGNEPPRNPDQVDDPTLHQKRMPGDPPDQRPVQAGDENPREGWSHTK